MLSPFLGSSIYLAFGINRVARRGARVRWAPKQTASVARGSGDILRERGAPDALVALAHAGERITGQALTEGNHVTLLEGGDAAFPAMIAAIDGAQQSVFMSSYIFAMDKKTGEAFVVALAAAHGRGVQVRVLVDGIGGGYVLSRAVNQLRRHGVPTAQFMHSWQLWQMPFVNLRNHKKLLIVDHAVGFAGGINISDETVQVAGVVRERDVHVRLAGPIVAHLMASFARDWHFTTKEALDDVQWWQGADAQGGVAMRGITSGPDENVGRIEEVWASAIEQARHRVRILTPYFLPEDRMLDLLRRAALRGVQVEIIVPERTNHFYVDWAFRAHLETMPLDLIACHLTREPFDHSKLMSVDGEWCAFGSPNWDARSLRLNFEFLVECYDGSMTGQVDALMDAKMVGAQRLTKDMLAERTWLVRLRDACARLFLPYI